MELWLAGGLLPLLLLTWLPSGLIHQVSATISVSVGLDFALQCLLQTGSNTTTGEMKCFNSTQNDGEKQNKARWAEESNTTMECTFKIWLENLTVKLYKPADLEKGNQTNTTALGENCTSPSVFVANIGICKCRVSITRLNLTDTGNGMQGTLSSCGTGTPQNNVTKKDTCLKGEKDEQQGGKWLLMFTRLNFLLYVLFGLAAATLLYMPIICVLLWQCQKNRKGKAKGKLIAVQVAEGDQLSTAAPVMGTEELTYANLKFEETKPTSSDIIYTKIKPLQQKQGGGDADAADTEADVFPEGEGK